MNDINIHSRADREKAEFSDDIKTNISEYIHNPPRHTKPSSYTTTDVVLGTVISKCEKQYSMA